MDAFISIAKNQARNSDATHKHGSVLICKNQVFTGYNHFTIGSFSSLTVHAEEHAIANFINWCKLRCFSDTYIRRKLRKSTLLTVRVKDDRIKYSPPCNSCAKLIQKYEIKRVVYSDHNETQALSVKKPRDLPQTKPSSGYRQIARTCVHKDSTTKCK